MTEKEVLAIYRATGGLLSGHFLLSSGLHSDVYLQSALVLQHPTHGARCLFGERENGVMRLRRGFGLAPGERCLVVEDVITTGGSTREVIKVVEDGQGVLVGVGALIDRSGGTATFPVKKAALATLTVPTYKPEDCPLCKAGNPAVKPGSRTPPKG